MSGLHQRTDQVQDDAGRRWIFVGITSSLTLHVAMAIAYFWTPNHNYLPPPAAATNRGQHCCPPVSSE